MPPASASPPPSKLLPLGDYSGPDATDRQVVDELLAAFSSDGSPPQRHRGLLGRVQAIVFYILTVLFASANILLWIQAGFAFVIASYPVYRFLSTIGVYTFLASLNVLARRLLGIRHHVFGDRIRRSTSVMLSNHPGELDWLFLWGMTTQANMIEGLRIVLKASIRNVPLLGMGVQAGPHLFLTRKLENDAGHIKRMLENYEERRISHPFQLLFFPEGTTLAGDTVRKSHAFAHKSGLPLYHYILHPRTAGLLHVLPQLKHWVDYVYDVTVCYTPRIPMPASLGAGEIPSDVYFYVKEYKMDEVPVDNPEKLSAWIHERWQEKSKRLESFYRSEPRAFPESDRRNEGTIELDSWQAWGGVATAALTSALAVYLAVAHPTLFFGFILLPMLVFQWAMSKACDSLECFALALHPSGELRGTALSHGAKAVFRSTFYVAALWLIQTTTGCGLRWLWVAYLGLLVLHSFAMKRLGFAGHVQPRDAQHKHSE